MLHFHNPETIIISFQGCEAASSDDSGEKISVNLNLLKDQSKIFRSEQLSKYQATVNAASFELCQKDGSLLMNKGNYFSFLVRRSTKRDMLMPRKNQGQSTMVSIQLQSQRESTQQKTSDCLE